MTKLRIKKTKLVYKIAKKAVNEIFNYIIEDDFNPDAVNLGLLDAYENGLMKGLVIGTSIASIVGISVGISVYVKMKGEINE